MSSSGDVRRPCGAFSAEQGRADAERGGRSRRKKDVEEVSRAGLTRSGEGQQGRVDAQRGGAGTD